MAWNDVLAGLSGALGGATQGLGQIQDMRQQQIQQQLRERQAKLQEDQARRQAVEQAWATTQEGHVFDAPEQAQQFVSLGYGVIKDPVTGRPMKPKSIQTQAQELQLKNTQGDLDWETKQREALGQLASPEAINSPMAERQRLGLLAGVGPDKWMQPQEVLQYDPSVKAAGIRSSTDRYVADKQFEGRMATEQADFIIADSKLKFEEAAAARGENAARAKQAWELSQKNSYPGTDPARIAAGAMQFLQQMNQVQGQSAPTSSPTTQPGNVIRSSKGNTYQVKY